ncbi:MAG: hypothetical protein PHF74_04810 [Dehalococcoidales bacterium]|nr:hypothetical protein [Dehalococcoidales bacterium]
MGIFDTSITDEEWRNKVFPIYKTLLQISEEISKIVSSLYELQENDRPYDIGYDLSLESDFQSAYAKLFPLITSIKSIPSPQSSDMRQAKKHLESAIKDYSFSLEYGKKYFEDLRGDVYQRLHWGGINARAALTRLISERNFFQETEKSAQKTFKEVESYFPLS